MKCKWHKCSKEFEPKHHLQTFCTPTCAARRAQWTGARGPALVDIVLSGDMAKLDKSKTAILAEIKRDTPT